MLIAPPRSDVRVTPLRGKLVVGLRWELEGKKEEKKKKTSHSPAPLFPGPADVSLNALQPCARFTSDLSVWRQVSRLPQIGRLCAVVWRPPLVCHRSLCQTPGGNF